MDNYPKTSLFTKGAAVLLLLFFGLNLSASAQNQAAEDSTELAFLPAIAYDSDLGLIAGGIVSRYRYRQQMNPFYSFLNFYGIATTRGLISLFLEYDKPYIFNSDQRFYSEVFISRFSGNQYYGIGNYNELPQTLLDSTDYYLYNSFSAGFDFMLRKPLIKKANSTQLDVYGKVTYEYETPYDNNESQLIIDEQPEGVNGSHISAVGTGIVWEGRNHEFNPTSGTYVKTGFELGGKVIGSDYNYLLFETDARAYTSFKLIKRITFANRLFFQHTSGKLPYWQLPDLGGAELMRGYPEYRFRDENAVLLNSELRTWLFEFPSVSTRLGGTLFTDIGRTFPNGESINTITSDLKYTFGFGATASFFTADFIMRADIGFSEEDYGIYFTAGYLF